MHAPPRLQFFYNLGLFVTRRPFLTIALSVCLCILCGLGFLNFDTETDPEVLFTPQDSQAAADKRYVEDTFGASPTDVRVYVTAPTRGDDVVSKAILNDLFDAAGVVQSATTTWNGETLTYDNRCLKSDGTNCAVMSVLDWWGNDRATMNADTDLYATLSGNAYDVYGDLIPKAQVHLLPPSGVCCKLDCVP